MTQSAENDHQTIERLPTASTGDYRFDATCAIRTLDLIGKNKAVNAFKETESER